jgi:predicted acylesterase/phospholipase RssA
MSDPVPGRREAAVFSGGGAYGAYAVGAYKALAAGQSPGTGHRPLKPQIFTGTSAGAVNAGILVSASELRDPAAHLEKVWKDQIVVPLPSLSNSICRFRPDLMRWFDVPALLRDPGRPIRDTFEDTVFLSGAFLERTRQLIKRGLPLDQHAMEIFDLTLLFSPQPFHKLVESAIDFAALRCSSLRLVVVTTNWRTGEVQLFTNQPHSAAPRARMLSDTLGPKAVLASAAIPGLFAPVVIDGMPYADGGVLMNSPLKPAIDAGGDVLHVIQMEPDMSRIPPAPSSFDTIYRLMVINNRANLVRDVKTCEAMNQKLKTAPDPDHRPVEVHLYRPSEALQGILGLLDFSAYRVEKLIQLGEQDAQQHDCKTAGCILAN